MAVGHDQAPPPPGGVGEPRAYTEVEEHALGLAEELRDRVRRERAVVRDLRAYLADRRTSAQNDTPG
jgi:hypothetical protein